MKKFFMLLFILCLSLTFFMGCQKELENKTLILATTTSTENSGLLEAILPVFEQETGITVEVIAVGTGAALQKGVDGEADILLVHAKTSEEEFVKKGHGLRRSDVMYNDFVIVGPENDPADLKAVGMNVVKALTVLSESGESFISRGDDSGTHKKELSIWQTAGIEPSGDWYVEVGKGMGDTLAMTDELLGYTLTDRATFLSMKENLELVIVVEGDSSLFNQYGVIPINPSKNDMINGEAAEKFEKWLLSKEAQELIKTFGVEKYGEPLFVPNAK